MNDIAQDGSGRTMRPTGELRRVSRRDERTVQVQGKYGPVPFIESQDKEVLQHKWIDAAAEDGTPAYVEWRDAKVDTTR